MRSIRGSKPFHTAALRRESRKILFGEAGFSLLEIMVAAALAVGLAVGVATIQVNQTRGDRINAGQASKSALATAIRQQLSRSQTCKTNLTTPPATYSGRTEIAVRLGSSAAAGIAQAGADLKSWKVQVTSLNARNFSHLPNTSTGNSLYSADIYLSVQDANINAGKTMAFSEVLVMQLLFEVNGGGLASCYSDGVIAEAAPPLQQLCDYLVSPGGTPGYWSNGHCVVDDNSAYNMCVNLQGTWTGSACRFSPQIFVVARGVPAGSPAGVAYGVQCPTGSYITGGACDYGPAYTGTQLGDYFYNNGYYCQWPPGATSYNYNIYATCAR